ncbi:MAG: hypothetical protein R3F14_37980 [Polyangiaceae bacterium]
MGSRYRFMIRKVGVTAFAPLLSNRLRPATAYRWVGTTRVLVTPACIDDNGWYDAIPDVGRGQ